ncbi:MAG: YdcF family protein [bacterium]|nr:YdcF family protein [bacterium]
MKAFIICGYGIPENVSRDVNYTTYLHLIFNSIFEQVAQQEAVIIPCGGPTKCDPPFVGTEAEAITDYLTELAKRNEVSEHAKKWIFISETESLSTLENLLFAKKMLDDIASVEKITIFCEKTREKRVQAFADKIFDKSVSVSAIDFDISKNRYLDSDTLNTKEDLAMKEGLWTLQELERLEKHHEFFEKKFEFLRRRQSEGLSHVDAVKEWFENQQDVIRELMPDHPFLQESS